MINNNDYPSFFFRIFLIFVWFCFILTLVLISHFNYFDLSCSCVRTDISAIKDLLSKNFYFVILFGFILGLKFNILPQKTLK